MAKNIAVYGSLRKGHYNYERFKERFPAGMDYVKTDIIYGWKLYSLGSYPGIKHTGDTNDTLTVDVLNVSQVCFRKLNSMEIGAGYIAKQVAVGDTMCTIWEFNYPTHVPNIKSGDWSKYLQEKKENKILESSY